MYDYEMFKSVLALNHFLNKKHIAKENIIAIYTDSDYHYLIYII